MAHKITYREHGQGPLLILLHGFGGSVHHWESCIEDLSKHYRVVVPNLTHLFMSTDRIFFTVQVEAIARFIHDHFPGEKAAVAGLSFGAALAWGLSALHPEIVSKAVLINPMIPDPIPSFSLPELRYFFVMPMSTRAIYVMLSTPIGRAFLKRAAMIFRDERSGGIHRLDQLKGRRLLFVSHLIFNFTWMLRREDWHWWREKVAQKTFPNLVIFDRDDLLFSRETYLRFAQDFHSEKVVELTGTGHLSIKARPDLVSREIHEYLSGVVHKAA